jgi:GNAT superfamily N-acetyltransferase
MAGIRLREGGPRDAASVARVQHASWRTAYLGMLPHEILVALDGVVVAELGADVVGFVSFGPIRERIPGYGGEFYALYVLPEAQGCGVGTALMAQAARSLVRNRWAGAAVWVLEENHPGRRFYERLGGLPLGMPKALQYRGQEFQAVREVAYGWPDLRRAAWLVEH